MEEKERKDIGIDIYVNTNTAESTTYNFALRYSHLVKLVHVTI